MSIATLSPETDWNFTDISYSKNIYSLHPYPAKFIPDIPRELIKQLGVPLGTAIFDPFCGSGTTLIEAQRSGFCSIGVDLNPIACLISRVKTRDLPKGFFDVALEVFEKARDTYDIKTEINLPNVDHWFKKDVQNAINAILREINEVRNKIIQETLKFILSSIIVKVSNQESDTRYASIEKNTSAEFVFQSFIANSLRFSKVMEKEETKTTWATVINKDICDVAPTDLSMPIGLVITSPPYPNAYEYWLYHKYRMLWLGYDPIGVKNREIGARAHFFKKDPHTAFNFKSALSKTFALLEETVISGGHVCFVVGRSKIHGQIINNGFIVECVAKDHGFFFLDKVKRNIESRRKSFNLSYAKIRTEEILVFKRR
ncbi:MAG: class I SAM-dependent methyltransferase [Candidatus Omnitrophica bacterium]|nr:class I SAM-dependent methyltransferase [Candidatus Omnitrophota bacterium]